MVTRDAVEKVEHAINAIKSGKMVIMVDEEDRENEGDLVFAAEYVTPELINFMAKEARGLICLTMAPEYVDRLKLPMMGDTTKTSPSQSTAFTVSIEARDGVTTGISAADRSHTIKVAIAEGATPDDIVVPGHIFPLKARAGGVLDRAGHTEGSVDLAKLAGLKGAGVICEIMNDDGTMARMPDLEVFAEKHDIPIIAISDMIQYRLLQEPIVKAVKESKVKTAYGEFTSVLFENIVSKERHLALTKGGPFHADQIVDVRVHNHRPFIDVFACPESKAGFRLDYGLNLLKNSQNAAFIYLVNEGQSAFFESDLDLLNPDFNQPEKKEKPLPGVDDKMLGTGAQILRSLGISKMRIHSTFDRNLVGLSGYGLEVVEVQTLSSQQGV